MDEWGLVLYGGICCFGGIGKTTQRSLSDKLTQWIVTVSKAFIRKGFMRPFYWCWHWQVSKCLPSNLNLNIEKTTGYNGNNLKSNKDMKIDLNKDINKA